MLQQFRYPEEKEKKKNHTYGQTISKYPLHTQTHRHTHTHMHACTLTDTHNHAHTNVLCAKADNNTMFIFSMLGLTMKCTSWFTLLNIDSKLWCMVSNETWRQYNIWFGVVFINHPHAIFFIQIGYSPGVQNSRQTVHTLVKHVHLFISAEPQLTGSEPLFLNNTIFGQNYLISILETSRDADTRMKWSHSQLCSLTQCSCQMVQDPLER